MPNESLELSLLSLFSLISFFIFLIIQKLSHKIFKGALLDNDFNKPQAFHTNEISRIGGLAALIAFSVFLILSDLAFGKFYYDYFVISLGIFFIGFLEDVKFNLSPKIRLISMIFVILISIVVFSIDIKFIDYFLLSILNNSKLFMTVFVLLCFLFIINGSNLIDGFNGLLSIHLIIINIILMMINFESNHTNFATLITAQIIVLITFLLFNFPKAKIFMGDGGAYFFGALTSLNIIYTNNFNSKTSSFFFCILLFYIFFEVFFSFFRKIYQKKSPFRPDGLHLHMLLFKSLKIKTKIKDCNYLTSLAINAAYIILILPSILLKDNASFAMYWFFSLLVIYLLIFLRLYSFIKKQIDI